MTFGGNGVQITVPQGDQLACYQNREASHSAFGMPLANIWVAPKSRERADDASTAGTKRTLEVDEAQWQTAWSGNFSAAIGANYCTWTASLLKDRIGRLLVCVVRDEPAGDSEAVGELGRPLPEDIPPILQRLCERAGLEDFPDTWEIPALRAAKRSDAR